MALPTEDNIYGYSASKPAAIVFTVLNSILMTYHGYLSLWLPCRFSHPNSSSIRNKHRYTICLWLASLLASAGYSIRVASIGTPGDVGLYATQSSYVVISPIFVCASLYWQLKHLVLLLLPREQQRIFGFNPLWLGRIFIASDVTSFLTQGAGSGIASSGNWEGSTLDAGVGVLLGGLSLQLATFTAYLGFLVVMVVRARRRGGLREGRGTGSGRAKAGAGKVLRGVYVAGALVQTRTIFRLVEFALGIQGYPFQNEWMLYVFESVPMFVALAALAWWHPIKHLQGGRFYEQVEGGHEVKSVPPEEGREAAKGGVRV